LVAVWSDVVISSHNSVGLFSVEVGQDLVAVFTLNGYILRVVRVAVDYDNNIMSIMVEQFFVVHACLLRLVAVSLGCGAV
jgi:hypothetical protein